MIEKAIIVTNNSLVMEKLNDRYEILYVDGTLMEVLILARDYIHKGHKLLTHPLSGSVKPNETPFKTVLISRSCGKTNDMDSLVMIENSIHTVEKFLRDKKAPEWNDRLLEDFRLIDYDLIFNAIN